MHDDNTSVEFDNNEILNKVDSLLHKHHNQSKVTEDLHDAILSSLDHAQISDYELRQAPHSPNNEIPTLNEVVILRPVTMPDHSECNLTLQQILDAALQEVKIDLDTTDRIALFQAIEKRLISHAEKIG
jgi:hypothetical protein